MLRQRDVTTKHPLVCPYIMFRQHVPTACPSNLPWQHGPTTCPYNISSQHVPATFPLNIPHNIHHKALLRQNSSLWVVARNIALKLLLFGRYGCLRRLATFVTFCGTFLSRPLLNHDMKFPHATFYGSYKYAAKSFPFSLRHVLRRLQICREDFFPSLLRLNWKFPKFDEFSEL